mmetsp:Transcript_1231/g.1989  ORF Transcript_1231/g.1989 Transcript_1231/m.1989 type:complete len:257 (-) Transcript_1231:260-1030(-)
MGGVFDDRDHQLVVVPVADQPLDHLLVADAELLHPQLLAQQRGQHALHPVAVEHGAAAAELVGVHEERGAGGELVRARRAGDQPRVAQHAALEVQHEEVLGGHALLLHARGRHVDAVAVAHADAAARARHPPQVVELFAEVDHEVAGVRVREVRHARVLLPRRPRRALVGAFVGLEFDVLLLCQYFSAVYGRRDENELRSGEEDPDPLVRIISNIDKNGARDDSVHHIATDFVLFSHFRDVFLEGGTKLFRRERIL